MVIEFLAAKRLTRLIVEDEIARPIRENATGKIGYLVNCPYCVSVWSSLFIVILAIMFPRVSRVLNRSLAISEMQALLTDYESRKSAEEQDYGEPL